MANVDAETSIFSEEGRLPLLGGALYVTDPVTKLVFSSPSSSTP